MSDKDSYKNVDLKWLPELRTSAPSVPIILVGTKLDRRGDGSSSESVSTSEGTTLQQKHSFFAFVECSAKMLTNYKMSFDKAIFSVLKHREKAGQKIKKKKGKCIMF